MFSLQYFVSIGAVLFLVITKDNGVTAAPHPCLWMLDYDHNHQVPTTTTAKPDLEEVFAKLTKKKTNQLKELADWIMWGPSTEVYKPRAKNPVTVEKVISSYVKFLRNIINMF